MKRVVLGLLVLGTGSFLVGFLFTFGQLLSNAAISLIAAKLMGLL